MLSQTVNKCPGWNHEIAIEWRSKKVDFICLLVISFEISCNQVLPRRLLVHTLTSINLSDESHFLIGNLAQCSKA